jgi:PD-(D/E)XK nuclease superfamily
VKILAHETHQMTRKEEKLELICNDESCAIIGACFAVDKDKGCGFLEPVYPECLEIELELQRIRFQSKARQTFVSEILTSFRVFRGQIALFRAFSGPTTSEIFAHGTREMTRSEQIWS